jgi:uncharacterized PurR-regulated membrane protein YhhQ (DUF165 family)
MTWSIIYITCILLAQYTAEWFIPFPLFGLLSTGTIVFGATFTARDYVHRLGRRKVYVMIAVAAVASLVMVSILEVPIRIIIASIIAIVLAETADTEIYHKLLSKSWFVRVVSSNTISVPLDTVLFTCIAFLFVFPLSMLVEIIFADIVVKFAVGLVIAIGRRNGRI